MWSKETQLVWKKELQRIWKENPYAVERKNCEHGHQEAEHHNVPCDGQSGYDQPVRGRVGDSQVECGVEDNFFGKIWDVLESINHVLKDDFLAC